MEKQKVRYKKEFGERMIEENWEDFITFIGKEEQHIRNCYSETSHLQSLDFITMILYDAIFIIELFLKFWESVQESETSSGVGSKFQECKNDFLLNKPWLTNGLQRDLQLLENQLPYFVLEELYKSTIFKVQPEDQDFLSLTVRFFCDSMCSRKHTYYSKLNHFTDLRRRDFTDLSRSDFTDLRRRDLLQNDPEECPFLSDLPSAVKLNESGVKFKVSTERYLADIERELRNFKIPIPYFSGVELKIPYFSGVELKIPHLLVVDNTESMIRNVMAFEQCHYPKDTHICNYISFMDFLIDTEKDVDLLIDKKIISNLMGNSATIVKIFNRLCLNINLSGSCYNDIATDLKAHHDNGWNHAKATLKRVYFSNPWKGYGTVAAIILLLLTLTQTICSIMQVV